MSHGHTKQFWKSPTYNSWSSMKDRCTNPNNPRYMFYGDRGVTFSPAWESFDNFLADMGERPEGTTLDREDNDGDYCIENCRWATVHEQNRNTSTNKYISYNDETKTNQEWADQLGIAPSTLYNRIFTRKWSVEKAFSTPVRFKRCQQ